MASEQFSLCWDNFHKNMSSGMQSLLESEDLVDVTLAVEGRSLKAHKMVLSVCSPYFRELFQGNPCKHPIVFLKDVSYIALSDLLQFMYQGEVQVAQENLPTFIKTAEALQIKGLTQDNNVQNEIETIEASPPEKHIPDTKQVIEVASCSKPSPITRVKRLAGPASKRPRISLPSPGPSRIVNSSFVTSTPATDSVKTTSVVTMETPIINDSIHLKVEPAETQTQVETDESFNDNVMDDLHDDGGEDYTLMDASEDEPKAGTSADGDEQDAKYSIGRGDYSIAGCDSGQLLSRQRQKAKTRTRYVVGGFVYHNKLVAGKNPIRYLACAEMKRAGCRARAILPVGGTLEQLRITKPHNHPPDETAAEREEFVGHLRDAARSMPGSLKKVYDTIAILYPNASTELPYKSICSSLHRWRRIITPEPIIEDI